MGPGDRFQVNLFPGIMFGAIYSRWPYTHSITINVLCFSFFLGLGKSYIDPDYEH